MSPFLNLTALLWEAVLFAATSIPTRFFLHFTVRGLENLENLPPGPLVVMANHASQLDPGLLNLALPWTRRFRPAFAVALTKKDYLHLPLGRLLFGGRFFWLTGAYPAYKKQPTLADALPHHLAVLRKQHPVIIFPEGKLSLDGNFHYAHPGVAFLAHRAQATVIPTYISGDYLMTARDFFMRKRHVAVTFGKPIQFSDYAAPDIDHSRDSYREVAIQMFEAVKNMAG